MARNIGTVVQNNLSRGLITEATGLNFPDNAVTEAWNTVFQKVGRVTRRRGIDIEGGAETRVYEESDGVIKEFLWQSVALRGGFTFLVIQVGHNIQFYEMTTDESLSSGLTPDAIDLRDYRAPGAPNLDDTPVSFASGAGYLFIAHPFCDPILIQYNDELDVFEVSGIQIMIRDFEGMPEAVPVEQNPVNLTSAHHYNLKNQGWFQLVRIGSANNEAGGAGGIAGWTAGLQDLIDNQ